MADITIPLSPTAKLTLTLPDEMTSLELEALMQQLKTIIRLSGAFGGDMFGTLGLSIPANEEPRTLQTATGKPLKRVVKQFGKISQLLKTHMGRRGLMLLYFASLSDEELYEMTGIRAGYLESIRYHIKDIPAAEIYMDKFPGYGQHTKQKIKFTKSREERIAEALELLEQARREYDSGRYDRKEVAE